MEQNMHPYRDECHTPSRRALHTSGICVAHVREIADPRFKNVSQT